MVSYEPSPDFERLRRTLLRQGEPDRVPVLELHVDRPVKEAFLGRSIAEDPLAGEIEFWYRAGYDFVEVWPGYTFPREHLEARDTAPVGSGVRSWQVERDGVIQDWEDVEKYPWPKVSQVDFSGMERAARLAPEGMMIIPNTAGVFEHTSWLMGIESFCYALVDKRDLVAEVFRRVGQFLLELHSALAEMERVGALWLGDDLGFNTGTFISPAELREFVFPWHRRIAEVAHAKGLPFLLHSCGNLHGVLDDLVDYVGINALHSLPPGIYDIVELKARYGERIALVGNVDVDLLARGTPEQVRQWVRRLIETVGPGGGLAVGSSNSITNYCRVENYVAMLEEVRAVGTYPLV